MTEQQDFQNWELDKLSNYIVDTHHVYVRKAIPEITTMAHELVEKNVNEHPELKEIADTFETMSKGLEEHMAGEEKYLFPYIEKLLKAQRAGEKLPKPGFGSIDVPLKHHYEDHDHSDQMMKQIRELCKDYNLSENASASYQKFYEQLKQFEADLKQHIYIENEVLFGKSIELEKAVVE